MTSSHLGTVLHRDSGRNAGLCPAVNISVPGMAVCSLPEGTHEVHQLRCEETGAVLGVWSDSDRTFREPSHRAQREMDYGDVA